MISCEQLLDMASVYDSYRKWCESIGVAPATEEKYERVVEYLGDRIMCACCRHTQVSVIGNVCSFCQARGAAPTQ